MAHLLEQLQSFLGGKVKFCARVDVRGMRNGLALRDVGCDTNLAIGVDYFDWFDPKKSQIFR